MKPLFYVFRTTFLPTGAVFIGFHQTDDVWFGTPMATDPYLGKSAKLEELIRKYGRTQFAIQPLFCGNEQAGKIFYKNILRNADYNSPLCLNSQLGAGPAPKSPEHIANVAAALSVAMVNNTNSVGNPTTSLELPEGFTRKWVNNGVEEELIVVERGVNAQLPDKYKDYKLGRLKKVKTKSKSIENDTSIT